MAMQGMDECARAYRQIIEGAVVNVAMDPRILPPPNSRLTLGTVRAVINVPAAVDSAANSGGTSLGTAEGATVVTPTNLGEPEQVALHQTPVGHVTVFVKWGVTVEIGNPASFGLHIRIDGPNSGSDRPNGFICGGNSVEALSTMLIVPENGKVWFGYSSSDSRSAMLATLFTQSYVFPITKWDGTLKSLFTPTGERPGFSPNCGVR